MIDARLLVFPNSRGAEATKLNQLINRSTELASKVDELERQQRATHTDVAEASNALEQLERRSLGGEKVSDAQRRRAEEALARARQTEQEPWSERVRAARLAVQDAEQRIRGHVAESLDKLVLSALNGPRRNGGGIRHRVLDFVCVAG